MNTSTEDSFMIWSSQGMACMTQRYCLAIMDLQCWTDVETGALQQDAFEELACWACDGSPTDVKVN